MVRPLKQFDIVLTFLLLVFFCLICPPPLHGASSDGPADPAMPAAPVPSQEQQTPHLFWLEE